MDNDEFLRRLTQVAEWHRPLLGPTGGGVFKKRRPLPAPPVLTAEELAHMTDEQCEAHLAQLTAWRETQPNPSVPPEITRVRCSTQACEDCDRTVTGRQVEIRRHDTGRAHWRSRCITCGLYQDPRTGAFDITAKMVHNTLGNWYRRTTPDARHTPEVIVSRKALRLAQLERRQRERVTAATAAVTQLQQHAQYHMVPYDSGDSTVWRREPVVPTTPSEPDK